MSEIKIQGSDGWYLIVPTADLIAALNAAPLGVRERVRDGAFNGFVLSGDYQQMVKKRDDAIARAEKAEAASVAAQNRHIVAERERNEARDERDRLQREIAKARQPRAPSADLPLGPESQWVGNAVVDGVGDTVQVAGCCVQISARCDGPKMMHARNVIAVLARAGLLPPGDGIPRERVRKMLCQSYRQGAANTEIHPHNELAPVIADTILYDYDREKAGT